MNQTAGFSWQNLHDLFSVVMCFDETMTIIYASDTLSKCLPQTLSKPLIFDVFEALRPASLTTFSDGVNSVGSLCLLKARNGEFAIRGQLLQIQYKGQEALCFCGAPWLFWINSQAPDTQLGLRDFSPQDVQLDQLFFMSTEKKMVEDLERLNADLQQAKRQLEKAQETQRQFFAQMSHEIRTPLNGVVSALSLLEQLDLGPEQSRFLRLAESSSHNLMQVINYVLSISKLELSEQEDKVAFSCRELVSSTIDVVRAKAQQKSLPIKLEFSPDSPQACYGSPDRLRQTLLNLVMNAIKFTRKGQVTVRSKLEEQDSERGTLRLEVSDTGVGIPEGDMENIFEPFWSSMSQELAQQEQGTGLGLDIVRRNIRSMGGDIEVKSLPGKGTTFTVEIPVALPTEPVELSSMNSTHEKRATPQLSGHVLLVDDNDTNRMLGALILESMGLRTTTVSGGLAAVTATREQDFDLVLMDISMPDIDGLEATRQIRTCIPHEKLPIVALTAFVDDSEKAACLAVGMADYLTKPIIREELARVLATWLASDEAETAKAAGNAECRDSADTYPVKDNLVEPTILQELVRQIGRDNLDLVIGKVETEALQRWEQLEQAEAAGDADKVRLHVHSLGSIFRSVGLVAIGDSLESIEACLRAGEVPGPGWLPSNRQLWTDSRCALEKELTTL